MTSKFIFKANDEVLSFCDCADAPAMSEFQLDCPWCGCGWLIPCSGCGKSFTFAEVRETDASLVELGRREADRRGLTSVTDEEVEAWADSMAEALEHFEIGDVIVYLDGAYWKLDSVDVEFEGYFARHQLKKLPHAEALEDSERLRNVLGNPDYWFERELPDRDRS